MRGRSSSSSASSSSKQGGFKVKDGAMEIDKLGLVDKLKEEPPPPAHLSGAYIRSLVKQLTSSRTKEDHPILPKGSDTDGNGCCLTADKNKCQNASESPPRQPQQQQHKKQVRRRLHTSRPYQERLLNMAEARREIVTALKFHRAAMKQQAHDIEQQPAVRPPGPQQPSFRQDQGKLKPRRNHPRIYAPTTSFSNDYSSYSSAFPCPSLTSYPWPVAPPPSLSEDNLNANFALPNQPLGLNLNLHDFNNLDADSLYLNNCNSSTIYSPSASSYNSCSPSLSFAPTEAHLSQEETADHIGENSTGLLHHAMDDEEMAEMRLLGEQHQMEWNDTLNSVTSAWWFKFLKAMELGPKDTDDDDYDGLYCPFEDQLLDFPAWLMNNTSNNNNADNESSLLQHFLDDHCPDDYFQDPALPWLGSTHFRPRKIGPEKWVSGLPEPRYFEALDIDKEEEKVQMTVMSLTDTTALMWRRHYTDGCDVKT
ncbi:hypothetical protein RJ639_020232 [Escallonia herrerae]|uniref:Uncharacterized protein n=1 Tax=Escallonia herrerae TaxID=1293975 RepID=A0AA89AJW6_9ASTE|nr:hypothetical protein RJ639_020232 [Escallonia herrerae]